MRPLHEGRLRDFQTYVARLQAGVVNGLFDRVGESLLYQLARGHIDGDAVETAGGKLSAPSRKRPAGLLEHPFPEPIDQPQLLGGRNEIDRRYRLAVARPSNQRLEAGAHSGGEHDRLVVHLERVVLHRVAQVVLEAEPIQLACVHVGVEQFVPRLAVRLRVIHCGVRVAHDLFRIGVLGPAARDADAGRREHFATAD